MKIQSVVKKCIFCGDKPENKNKEHVIPKWLIEMTGDKKRSGYFGFDKFTEADVAASNTLDNEMGKPLRVYSFNSFAFPACEECNKAFGRKESAVKPILKKIINNDGIVRGELDFFFDWLDKVRVGLWLGMRQLDKDIAQIEPNYAINQRVAIFDRVLMVRRIKGMPDGINFYGVETYCFAMQPIAFCLRVNEFFFFNLSTSFLVSEGLGFPFSEGEILDKNSNKINFSVVEGRGSIVSPLSKKSGISMSDIFYQPMFGGEIGSFYKHFYNNEYVKEHSINFHEGRGLIFRGEDTPTPLKEYELIYFNYIESQTIYNEPEKAMLEIVKWQSWLLNTFKERLDLKELTTEQKEYVIHKIGVANRINDFYIEKLQNTVFERTIAFWK